MLCGLLENVAGPGRSRCWRSRSCGARRPASPGWQRCSTRSRPPTSPPSKTPNAPVGYRSPRPAPPPARRPARRHPAPPGRRPPHPDRGRPQRPQQVRPRPLGRDLRPTRCDQILPEVMLMQLKLAVAVALRIEASWAAARWSQQQLVEKPQTRQLFAGGHVGEIEEVPADGRQPQRLAGPFDGGLGGLSGHAAGGGERRDG